MTAQQSGGIGGAADGTFSVDVVNTWDPGTPGTVTGTVNALSVTVCYIP